MTRTGGSVTAATHPRWCAPERCGHLVPPVVPHLARRHRGPMLRVGRSRAAGVVATYLISGAVPGEPLVAVHVACRAGNAWAELSLAQAAELAGQLRDLLSSAADDPEADDPDADRTHPDPQGDGGQGDGGE
ncbi:hypothetical protein [Micromonospora sp. WMMD987]|uniref:hypothetical protein n=1 Tax=Micromonospora sp. WMMD987 TaxID=3016089 RepID=UPI00249B8621|nr:hypothetical protein [Micromonospora sp. WMMD987]WFE94871.1 hypothetical protein O7612_26690 [Micromonospora sp. WMMD987]